MELVYFPHRVVKDGRDNAAVAMAGRSRVALAEVEFADEGLALFVAGELEAHAVGIVLAAGEAVVLLELAIGGFVALDLAGHGAVLCSVDNSSHPQAAADVEGVRLCEVAR